MPRNRSAPPAPTRSVAAVGNDNLTLIGWVSQIYGVLWAVWIGQFFEKMTTCTKPTLLGVDLGAWYPFVLGGAGVLFLVYTFYLITWLWKIREVTPTSPVKTFAVKYRTGIAFSLLASAAIFVLGTTCNCVLSASIGVFVTLGWPIIVVAVLLFDWRGY